MLHRYKHNKKGFTLVEVIVVLVILAILAGLAGLGLTSYIRMSRFEHNESSARTAFQAAQIALTRKDTSGDLADFQEQLRDTGVQGKHFTAEALTEQYGPTEAAARADDLNSRIYALYYDKANPTSTASELVRDLIGPYVYDDSLFNASICLEIDALSGQVYSAFYDTNSDKLRFALDADASGAMLIDDRSFAHRRGESLVGYYSAEDTINVVQLTQTRLKVKNPLLINNETLTLNWSGNSSNGDLDTIYEAAFYDSNGDTPLFKLEINYAKISAEHLKNAHIDVYFPNTDGTWQDTPTVYTFPLSYSKGRFILTLDAMCDATLLRSAENDEAAAKSTLFSITRLTQGAKDIYAEMRARPNEIYADSLTESKLVRSNIENTLFVRGSNSDSAALKYFRHLYNLRWEEPTKSTAYAFSSKAANTTLDWTDGSVTVYCAPEDGGEPTPQVPSRTGDTVVAWPTIPTLNKNVVLTGTTASTTAGRGHIVISNLQLRSTSVAKDAKKNLPAGTPPVMAVDHYVGLVGENNGTISKITLRDVDVQVNAEVKKAAEADTATAMAMDANATQYLQPMTDTTDIAYRSEIWSVGALAGVDTGTLTDCTLDRSSRRGAEAKVTAVLHFSNTTTGIARADGTSIQDEPRGIGGLVGFAMPESGAKLSDLTIDQNVTVAGLLQDDDAGKNPGTTASTSTDAAEKARYKDIAEENTDKTLWRSVGVGGLAGVLDATNLTGTGNLANITNKSTVVGNAFAGGIAGNLYAESTAASKTLSELANAGTVLAGANYEGGTAGKSAVLGQFFGGIAGYARDLTLESCTSATRSGLSETALTNLVRNGYDKDGALNERSPLKGDFVGGLVGFGRDIQMTNCTTETGYVLGRRFVGGFVGGFVGSNLKTDGGINNSYVFGSRYVGGIVSVNGSNSQILNMTNKGLVAGLGKDAAYVGGIAGVNDASWGAQKTLSANDTAQLINSTNDMSTVEVTDRNKIALLQQLSKTADGAAHYADFVGGVAGYNGTNGRIRWTADSASGAKLGAVLYGGSYVGGVAGYNDASAAISNEHATLPSVSGRVVATVSCVGGVVGLNAAAKLPAVQVSANRIEGLYYVGGVVGANLPVEGFGFYDAAGNAAAASTIGTGRLLADGVAGGIIGYNRVIASSELTSAFAKDGTLAEDLASLLPGFGSGSAIADSYTYTSTNNVTLTGLSNQLNLYANAYVGGIIGYNAQATTLTLVEAVNGNPRQAQTYGGVALGIPKDATNGDAYILSTGVALGELDKNYNGYFAGGILGYTGQKTTLQNCRNYGGVQHPVAAGGLTGVNDGTISGGSMNNSMGNQQNGYRYLGGIAGINGATGTITNATLNENSSIRGGYDIGGIAGYNGGVIHLTSETKGNVYGITYTGGVAGYNLRTVTAGIVNTKVSGTTATGGVVGYNDEKATIGDTSATAQTLTVGSSTTVTSNNYGGGVAGVNLGTIANAVNTAKAVQVVNQYAGGIAGGNYGTIRNCTHSANGDRTTLYTGGGYAGGIAGINGGTLPDNTKADNTKAILKDVTVTGRVMAANGEAGGVTAHNYGTIDTAAIQGAAVSGTSDAIGGAAACNEKDATITGASLLARTSGTRTQGTTLSGPATRVGGLVGYNAGTLKDSKAETGALDLSGLTASDNAVSAGGAVGENDATTEGAEGLVTGVNIALDLQDSMAKYQNLGGVAGINNGTLEKCAYTGAIGKDNGFTTVGSTVGGIVGSNESGHEVKDCTVGYIELKVQGASNVGSSQDADTKLSSAAHIGGIAGRNRGTISGSTVGTAGHMGSIITARHGFVGGVAGSNSGTITTSGGEGTQELVTQINSWLEDKYKDETAEDGTVTKVLDSDAKNANLNQMVRVLTGKASGDEETAWQTKFNAVKGKDAITSGGYSNVYTALTDNQLMVSLRGGNTRNDFANGYVGGVTGFNSVTGQITDTASGQWFVYADNINQSWGAVGGIIGQNESDATTTSGLVNFAAVRRYVRGVYNTDDDDANYENSNSWNGSAWPYRNYHCDVYEKGSTSSDNYVGGVIGTQENRTGDRWTLANCVNIGTVFNSRSNNAAGVLSYWVSYGGVLENCYNFGTITTNANTGGDSSGTVGGIAGFFNAPIAGTIANLYRCSNYGSVLKKDAGANDVGGIFGKVEMSSGHADDAMTINVSECVNGADVQLQAQSMSVGIFCYIGPWGQINNVKINIDRCRNYCTEMWGTNRSAGIWGNRGNGSTSNETTTVTNCFALSRTRNNNGQSWHPIAYRHTGNEKLTGSNNYYMEVEKSFDGYSNIDGLQNGLTRTRPDSNGWSEPAGATKEGETGDGSWNVQAHRLYAGLDRGASKDTDGDNYYTFFAMLPKIQGGSPAVYLPAVTDASSYITLKNGGSFDDPSTIRTVTAYDGGSVGQLMLLFDDANGNGKTDKGDITDEVLQRYYSNVLDTSVPNPPENVKVKRSTETTGNESVYGRYSVTWDPAGTNNDTDAGCPASYYHITVFETDADGNSLGNDPLLEADAYDTKFTFESKAEWQYRYFKVSVAGVNSKGMGEAATSNPRSQFAQALPNPDIEIRLTLTPNNDNSDIFFSQMVVLKNVDEYNDLMKSKDEGGADLPSWQVTGSWNGNSFTFTNNDSDPKRLVNNLGQTARITAVATCEDDPDGVWMRSGQYDESLYVPVSWMGNGGQNAGLVQGTLTKDVKTEGTTIDNLVVTATLSFNASVSNVMPTYRVMVLGQYIGEDTITDADGSEVSLKGQYVTLAAHQSVVSGSEVPFTFTDLPDTALTDYENLTVVAVPVTSGLGDATTRWTISESEAAATIQSSGTNTAAWYGGLEIVRSSSTGEYTFANVTPFCFANKDATSYSSWANNAESRILFKAGDVIVARAPELTNVPKADEDGNLPLYKEYTINDNNELEYTFTWKQPGEAVTSGGQTAYNLTLYGVTETEDDEGNLVRSEEVITLPDGADKSVVYDEATATYRYTLNIDKDLVNGSSSWRFDKVRLRVTRDTTLTGGIGAADTATYRVLRRLQQVGEPESVIYVDTGNAEQVRYEIRWPAVSDERVSCYELYARVQTTNDDGTTTLGDPIRLYPADDKDAPITTTQTTVDLEAYQGKTLVFYVVACPAEPTDGEDPAVLRSPDGDPSAPQTIIARTKAPAISAVSFTWPDKNTDLENALPLMNIFCNNLTINMTVDNASAASYFFTGYLFDAEADYTAACEAASTWMAAPTKDNLDALNAALEKGTLMIPESDITVGAEAQASGNTVSYTVTPNANAFTMQPTDANRYLLPALRAMVANSETESTSSSWYYYVPGEGADALHLPKIQLDTPEKDGISSLTTVESTVTGKLYASGEEPWTTPEDDITITQYAVQWPAVNEYTTAEGDTYNFAGTYRFHVEPETDGGAMDENDPNRNGYDIRFTVQTQDAVAEDGTVTTERGTILKVEKLFSDADEENGWVDITELAKQTNEDNTETWYDLSIAEVETPKLDENGNTITDDDGSVVTEKVWRSVPVTLTGHHEMGSDNPIYRIETVPTLRQAEMSDGSFGYLVTLADMSQRAEGDTDETTSPARYTQSVTVWAVGDQDKTVDSEKLEVILRDASTQALPAGQPVVLAAEVPSPAAAPADRTAEPALPAIATPETAAPAA